VSAGNGAAAPAIECHDISVVIDGHTLLDHVSIDVPGGEWLTILGPNGSGKTTLLRVIVGLQEAAGMVTVAGTPLPGLRHRDRGHLVALVPQTPLVPAGMRVIDYVLLGRAPYIPLLGQESRHDVEVAREALAELDLTSLAGRVIDTLSGGERQRVFFARALAQATPVLLLDEPTTALDIGHQQDVLELVDQLRRTRDLTVVSTMHDVTLAGQYADRLVLLQDGRVVDDGPPAAVITAENLARHFGARVQVIDGPDGKIVIPLRGARTGALEDLVP
jgi:iron complex transport system ATP-binding protein